MKKLKLFSLTMAFIVFIGMIICIIFSKPVPNILIRGLLIFIILTVVLSIATQSKFIEMSKKESIIFIIFNYWRKENNVCYRNNALCAMHF